MRHERVQFENGSETLKDPRTGEAMHSLIGPMEEAELIYVRQSGLAQRLAQPDPSPLVVYDLGLGIAANAVSAISLAAASSARPLLLISFENDLDGIRQALEDPAAFPHLAPWVSTAQDLLKLGSAEGPGWRWELREGAYPETLTGPKTAPAPDLVFYDFYSPKTSPELWSEECLRKLRAQCRRTLLFTYGSSTPFRAGLLAAGFFVGEGVSTPAKRDTTIAATHSEEILKPLGFRWRDRLARSAAVPESLRLKALASPQFSGKL